MCAAFFVALGRTLPAEAQQLKPGQLARGGTILASQQDEGDAPRESEEDPFADHIETDRDSYTPATTTAGAGRAILESAYSFIDNRHVVDTHSFPESVLRVGLTRQLELRLGFNYEVGGRGNVVSSAEGEEGLEGTGILRESRTLYGFKYQATRQQRWLPESSFIIQGYTPTSGNTTNSEFGATYVFGWELPRRWKLDTGFHYETAGEKQTNWSVWSSSAVVRVPLGRRWAAHAEYFGIYPHLQPGGLPQHLFSPGVHYLITPDFEFGVRVGWGLNSASPRFFSNVGFGARF